MKLVFNRVMFVSLLKLLEDKWNMNDMLKYLVKTLMTSVHSRTAKQPHSKTASWLKQQLQQLQGKHKS